MFELLGSIFSGGITGIIGSAINSFAEYKNKKLTYEYEYKKLEHDQRMLKLEHEARLQITETEGDIELEQIREKGKLNLETVEASGFKASIESESRGASFATGENARNSWLFIFVDAVRGLIRPFLTIYLIAIVTLMYGDIHLILQQTDQHLSTEQSLILLKKITDTILYVATAVVLWWFGSRTRIKPEKGSKK